MSGSDQQEDERRRGDRIPINEEFSSEDSPWVSDLSLGGVFVHGAELLPVGSMVNLRFTVLIDDPVVIEALGKVVRHSRRPQGMGVEFASMQPEMSSRIEDVLARQRPLDSGKPLRLPEPRRDSLDSHDNHDDTTEQLAFGRPAPIGDVSFEPAPNEVIEDDITAAYPRLPPNQDEGQDKGKDKDKDKGKGKDAAAGEPRTSVFRPPPLPGAAKRPEVDENERTRQFPVVDRK